MNPWIWRIVIVLLAIGLVPLIVSGVSSLVVAGIEGAADSIQSLFEPLGRSGNSRLKGLIDLGLYLIAITILAKVLVGGSPRRKG